MPNSNLEEVRYGNASGPIERALAEERDRRAVWERLNGPLLTD